jgi:hypothetical protein
MPPKPCPPRLRRFINHVNEQPLNPPHVLRQILHAIQDRKQNKGPDTLPVESLSIVTVNLTNYSIEVRNDLANALKEIDPPTRIDLIRECSVCSLLFWAGRDDKKACDKHAGYLRKKRQRQTKKEQTDKQKLERKDAQRKKPLKALSHTAVAVLNSIVIHGNRLYHDIDDAAALELKQNPAVQRVANRRIVRQVLTMLVDREYLTHSLGKNANYDIYEPAQQLAKDWTELRRAQEPPNTL